MNGQKYLPRQKNAKTTGGPNKKMRSKKKKDFLLRFQKRKTSPGMGKIRRNISSNVHSEGECVSDKNPA